MSTKMVEKLNLKKVKHPTPYKVSWLHKGHQLLVTEQSEFDFQIGSYKDKVTCDIMPMDVCHVLLGRPWQFERKVIHDGNRNCYKFEIGGYIIPYHLYKKEIELQQMNQRLYYLEEKNSCSR